MGKPELSRVLDIELGMVQNRVFETSGPNAFLFNATNEAKELLLEQGTDVKFGARPLKRAIERMLVHPMSNLIATEQIRGGDIVKVDLDEETNTLSFVREAEGMSPFFLQQLSNQSLGPLAGAVGAPGAPARPDVPVVLPARRAWLSHLRRALQRRGRRAERALPPTPRQPGTACSSRLAGLSG